MNFKVRGLNVNVVKPKLAYCSKCHVKVRGDTIVKYADVEATDNGHALVYHSLCINCTPDFIKEVVVPDHAPTFIIKY